MQLLCSMQELHIMAGGLLSCRRNAGCKPRDLRKACGALCAGCSVLCTVCMTGQCIISSKKRTAGCVLWVLYCVGVQAAGCVLLCLPCRLFAGANWHLAYVCDQHTFWGLCSIFGKGVQDIGLLLFWLLLLPLASYYGCLGQLISGVRHECMYAWFCTMFI